MDAGLTRRELLARAGSWTLGVLVGAFAGEELARAGEGGFAPTGFTRAPLPGACLTPETEVERTLAALLDTVVPGPDTDPDGTPGVLEGCGLNVLLDAAYPFKQYATLFATLLDQLGRTQHGAAFVALAYEQRLDVLERAAEQLPLLRLAYRTIRSAFFGGAYNGVGLDYVGYPGPSLGYRHVEQCSYRRPVCREMTETGWMP